MLAQIPLDAPQKPRHPPALRFEKGHAQLGIELEDAAEHQGDQRQLHFRRMAGDMAHEAVLAKARLDRRIVGSGALMEAQRDLELLQKTVERVPIGGVPITAVYVIGANEGADRTVLVDAAQQLLAGEVDVVHRQHRRHLQLVGAVPAEFVQPIVVGATNRVCELRIHAVARQERQPRGRKQHGDVDPFHGHAHDLRLGVVAALGREHHALVGTLGDERTTDAVVLRNIAVIAGRQPVEVPDRAPAHAGRAAGAAPNRGGDARLEGRVEVFVEQVRRLHDVHVAIDEPVSFFHGLPPAAATGRLDPAPNPGQHRAVLAALRRRDAAEAERPRQRTASRLRRPGPHRRIMARLPGWCDEAAVAHWLEHDLEPPSWPEAWRRLRQDGRPSRVKHPSAAQRRFDVPEPRTGANLRLKCKRDVRPTLPVVRRMG